MLVQLTLGQLLDYLRSEGVFDKPEVSNNSPHRYVYGIRGIMSLFNVSNVTAQRYKRTVIKDAVCQRGRTIVVDADLALKLFNEKMETNAHFARRKAPIEPDWADDNYERKTAIQDFQTIVK